MFTTTSFRLLPLWVLYSLVNTHRRQYRVLWSHEITINAITDNCEARPFFQWFIWCVEPPQRSATYWQGDIVNFFLFYFLLFCFKYRWLISAARTQYSMIQYTFIFNFFFAWSIGGWYRQRVANTIRCTLIFNVIFIYLFFALSIGGWYWERVANTIWYNIIIYFLLHIYQQPQLKRKHFTSNSK